MVTVHASITKERVGKAVKASFSRASYFPGFCIKCGAASNECEPDAAEYTCKRCGDRKVYGAELLLMYLG